MARLVLHTAKGPQEVNGAWLCRCGLSKGQPLCDGAHNKTKDEKEGVTYFYDENGERKSVYEIK